MKRAILPALALALLLAVPAIPQGGGGDLAQKVDELADLVKKQQEQLGKLEAYVEALKQQSESLGARLATARKDGFTYPAPNTSSREALLKGLQDFAAVAASGEAKAAAADEE